MWAATGRRKKAHGRILGFFAQLGWRKKLGPPLTSVPKRKIRWRLFCVLERPMFTDIPQPSVKCEEGGGRGKKQRNLPDQNRASSIFWNVKKTFSPFYSGNSSVLLPRQCFPWRSESMVLIAGPHPDFPQTHKSIHVKFSNDGKKKLIRKRKVRRRSKKNTVIVAPSAPDFFFFSPLPFLKRFLFSFPPWGEEEGGKIPFPYHKGGRGYTGEGRTPFFPLNHLLFFPPLRGRYSNWEKSRALGGTEKLFFPKNRGRICTFF